MGAMNVVNNIPNYFSRAILLLCALISLIALIWASVSIASYNFFKLLVLMLTSFLIGVLPSSPVNKSVKEKYLYFAICFLGIVFSVLVFQEYVFSPQVNISIKVFFGLVFCAFFVMAVNKYNKPRVSN